MGRNQQCCQTSYKAHGNVAPNSSKTDAEELLCTVSLLQCLMAVDVGGEDGIYHGSTPYACQPQL